ncbi:AraC family transcriptional regulator [Nocardia tengchongensis]|uniref:AraC family transcriptional regulator n=1 Tax=Nocardia tengchongensis TaxID=2055889 RepID=UPI0036A6B7B1
MISGLGRDYLDDDRLRIPSNTVARLWKLLYDKGGPEVGVRAAGMTAQGRLHVWDYLFTAAPTLAEGFTDAARFAGAIGDPVDESIVTGGGDPQLCVGFRTEPRDEAWGAVIDEYALGVLLHRARAARGSAADPVRVDFPHRAPRNHRYLIDLFGTSNINFEQSHSSLTMLNVERADPEQPYDPELRRIMHLYAQSVIDNALPQRTWEETLHAAISEVLAEGRTRGADIETVAHRLAISPRTLQRRLADRDTSWRREFEAVRLEQATRLLLDTQLPVESIAGRIGYSNHRALGRAFRRWTGQSPDAYRRTHHQRE